MLGSKLEMPRREGAAAQARPILGMQTMSPVDPCKRHIYGWEAGKAVEDACKHIASLLTHTPKLSSSPRVHGKIDNMAVKGITRFHKDRKKHDITTQTSVLDSCRKLQEDGFGLDAAIRPTPLMSIMTLNNKSSVTRPMKESSALIRKHCDAAGQVPLNMNEMNVDLIRMTGYEIYGSKGTGAPYVCRRPRERGLRSGTLAAALVVDMSGAARVAKQGMAREHVRITEPSICLTTGMNALVDDVVRNGNVHGYPGCVNISFAYAEGESLMMALKDVALCSDSACTSASLELSYVLFVARATYDMAHSSLQFGIGRFTTVAEINFVIKLRDVSPLREMVQEGIDINTFNWAQY
ncbi:pyridoxal phosphate-dependent transferase [Sparassis latifolia]